MPEPDIDPSRLTDLDLAAMGDRALLERVCKQLDHLDFMIHDIDRRGREDHEVIRQLRPHIGRALALLDPGAKFRAALNGRNKARP